MTYPEVQMFVDGQWLRHSSGGLRPIVDPATGQVIGHFPAAGTGELQRALVAAERGFHVWSTLTSLERFKVISKASALLRARAPVIAAILTQEQGKPLAEALREVQLSADIIDFLSEESKRLATRGVPPRQSNVISQTVARVPVGPVAAFTPWNFPVNLPSRKLGGALAAGCSVIIKPDEQTPASCMELVRCFVDAGIPRGVLSLVLGEPAEISSQLIESPVISKVSFTGSVRVGRILGAHAARQLKRYTAELGGHAPVIVCDDVDVQAVAKLAVTAKYRGSGQVCASPIRFLVQRAIYQEFKEAFVAGARALRVGPGSQEGVQMGPLIAERRVLDMQAFVDDAVAHGGRLLCGGKRMQRAGFFFEPTVIEHASLEARVQKEEPFGPIALLDVFDELDAAISSANALRYGLAAYAFTRDLAASHKLSSSLRAGMVGVNHFGVSQPETPFGGVMDSGIGSESGLEGLLAYTDVKLISVGL